MKAAQDSAYYVHSVCYVFSNWFDSCRICDANYLLCYAQWTMLQYFSRYLFFLYSYLGKRIFSNSSTKKIHRIFFRFFLVSFFYWLWFCYEFHLFYVYSTFINIIFMLIIVIFSHFYVFFSLNESKRSLRKTFQFSKRQTSSLAREAEN